MKQKLNHFAIFVLAGALLTACGNPEQASSSNKQASSYANASSTSSVSSSSSSSSKQPKAVLLSAAVRLLTMTRIKCRLIRCKIPRRPLASMVTASVSILRSYLAWINALTLISAVGIRLI